MSRRNPVNWDLFVAIGLAAFLTAGCAPSDSGPAPEGAPESPTASAPAQPGATFLFEGARLILGDGGVIENGALLVEGDRILEVGTSGEVDTPPGATSFDLAGKTVIPALIDAHAHPGYNGNTSWGSENYTRENLIENLERYAYYGFGAVFSAGSDAQDLALEIQRAQREGEVEGARFLFGAGMAPPGQGPYSEFLGHSLAIAEQTGMTVLMGVASEEEGRAAVREVSAKEIPFIKIWVDDRGGARRRCRGRSIARLAMRLGRMASRCLSISRFRICRICSKPAWPGSCTVVSARRWTRAWLRRFARPEPS